MSKKLNAFLESFQKGYTKRNVDDLDEFVVNHFDLSADVQLLGTCDGEIYVGYERIKKLVESDWRYWGEFSINFESLIFHNTSSHCIVTLDFNVCYEFEDKPSVYSNFLEFIKENNEDQYSIDESILRFKQNESLWLLDHILHKRPDVKRKNYWPGKATFVLKKGVDNYKISQLSFALPVMGLFPDERFHKSNNYEDSYNKDLSKLSKSIDRPAVDIFSSKLHDDFYFVDVDGEVYHQKKGSEMMKKRLNYYDTFVCNTERGLFQESSEMFSFIHLCIGEKRMEENWVRKHLQGEIQKWINKNDNDLHKLYKIRQHLSHYNKEISMGDDYQWPLRLHGVVKKDNGTNKILMIALSYPSNTILEDKY